MSSVANLTRLDGIEFMKTIQGMSLNIVATPFALESANEALEAIRSGTIEGSAVLDILAGK